MEEFEHCCDDKSEKYKLGNIIRGLHGAFGSRVSSGLRHAASGKKDITIRHCV